ncbi:MAG: hypothetical protein WBN66_03540 [Smithella sp.]
MKYHPSWRPNTGCAPQGYFIDKTGLAYDFGRIKHELKVSMHYPKGAHIFTQLKFLGILDDFENGITTCELPFTFAD